MRKMVRIYFLTTLYRKRQERAGSERRIVFPVLTPAESRNDDYRPFGHRQRRNVSTFKSDVSPSLSSSSLETRNDARKSEEIDFENVPYVEQRRLARRGSFRLICLTKISGSVR